VWVVTRGGASASGLIHFSETLDDPVVPPWFQEIAYDLSSLHLASDGRQAWGAVTDVTPASLYRLSPETLKVFGGHDWSIASCATDVLPLGDAILVPACDGMVQRVSVGDDTLTIKSQVGYASGYNLSASVWTEVYLRQDHLGEITAYTNNSIRGEGRMAPSESLVTRLKPKKGLSLALEVDKASILDLATQGAIFMVILEDQEGKRQTLALDADP